MSVGRRVRAQPSDGWLAEGCGITLPPFLGWSDPHVVVDIAADAESAGWDGVFLWDHVTWNPAWGGTPPMADPWMCLAAAATATFRVLLGTVVTSLPRRRPQIVARQVVTLDHLSGGRAVLGVGIGEDFEYQAYGEPVQARGARLDEGLEIVTRLLSVDKCGSCTPSTDGSRRIHVVRKSPTICGCSPVAAGFRLACHRGVMLVLLLV